MMAGVFYRVPPVKPRSCEGTPFAANPLVASVLRENVRVESGRAVIPLWPHWPSLLGPVHEFGRVLAIGRNAQAVLGRLGGYPRVLSAPCGHCGCGADGSMEFYFSAWNRAAATVQEQPGGWLYAVEFFDAWGETLHKICLTPESDFEVFREWVEANQAAFPETLREDFSRRSLCGQEPADEEEAVFLRPEVFPALLRRMIDDKQAAHVVIGNEGFVQGADLLPASLRESGQWLFASNAHCGLHLRSGRLAEVSLHRVRWQEEVSNVVLKAREPEGRLVCALAPPREGGARDWNTFLADATAAFHLNPKKS